MRNKTGVTRTAIPIIAIAIAIVIGGCTSWQYAENIPEPTMNTMTDAHGNVMKTLTYEGTHYELESIIFAINKYGDETIARHDSLKSLGRGHTVSASSPMSSLEPWARSPFSSEEEEVVQNKRFREHLINISVLDEHYNLTDEWKENSAILFIIEGYEEEDVNEAHERSHVFFHNLYYYKAYAYQAVNSMQQEELDCMVEFLDYYDYSLTQDNIVDEIVAYYLQDDNQTGCFKALGIDINRDGTISEIENYLWYTVHPETAENET